MEPINENKMNNTGAYAVGFLDDPTFIRAVKRTPIGSWHQYDLLLEARGYGWDMMKDWADYMASADLENISQVMCGALGAELRDITKSYMASGGSCKATHELNMELSMLSIAGISKTLKVPMKIVWFNQTRTLRFFTTTDDEMLVKRYAETVIRRTFGTPNAMKLGKPLPEELEDIVSPKQVEKKISLEGYMKKLLNKGCFWRISSIAFFLVSIVFIPLQESLSFGVWYAAIMGVLLGLASVVVYIVKYRYVGKFFKLIKEGHFAASDFDDINPCDKAFIEQGIFYGENAFLIKKPHAVIPYEDVAWIHSYNGERNSYVFRLKNGKKFIINVDAQQVFNLINRHIKPKNKDILYGESNENKVEYHEKNPKALNGAGRAKVITGSLMMAFGLVCAAMGIINNTVDAMGFVIIGGIFCVGVWLVIYQKIYLQLNKSYNNLLENLRNSSAVNNFFKTVSVVTGTSTLVFLVCAYLELEPLIYAVLAIYGVSIILFFVSIFLKLGYFQTKKERVFVIPERKIEQPSRIVDVKEIELGDGSYIYEARPDVFLNLATINKIMDYLVEADFSNVFSVNGIKSGVEKIQRVDVTKSFIKNKKMCSLTPELQRGICAVELRGFSASINKVIMVSAFENSGIIIALGERDKDLAKRYAETIMRKSFNTRDALKLAKPHELVRIEGQEIHIGAEFFMHRFGHNRRPMCHEFCGAIKLTEKTPTLKLFEDGKKTLEYCLQTEDDEDFSGKYFLVSVRLGFIGPLSVPMVQIDGFISDTKEERKMMLSDIGYRMEGHFLNIGGENSKHIYEMNRGKDLIEKGLKYPGYTTPSNIRLVGICPECGKSFCFHGYALYMRQSDVAYSSDGLDCCEITAYDIDKNTWSYETEGKTFSYYNSFSCPHCKMPYIDYKKNPESKVFGVSACVHLGRKLYTAND